MNADDAGFDQAVRAPVPVLVDFWAAWCGLSRIVAPVVEALAQERAGRLKVLKLDVDANPVTASRYAVRSIPTLILIVEGQPVDTVVGAVPKGTLVGRVDPHLPA